GGGWTPKSDDFNPHISFTFTAIMNVTSVITQGHSMRDEWVTKYTVSYQREHDDVYRWVTDAHGDIIVFEGNTDRGSEVENALSESGIVARVIRVHSKQHHDAASMRVELLGCL
ncbi:hypothetical protein CAPTEDRAFT_38259, partial [Capitella teleta]